MTSEHVVAAGIETISRGELLSHANYQLQRAIENCLDPNTDAKAPRTMTIKVTIKPNANRSMADVGFQIDLKLPSDSTGSDQIFIRQSDSRGFVPKGEQLGFDDLVNETQDVTRLPAQTK